MAKWVHADVLDNGLNGIKNNAIRMLLVSAYTAGDSLATVNTNTLASVTVTGTDFTLSSSGSNRVCTTAAKTATASATAASPDLHIVFTNNVDKVLWATDETSNQPITSGNVINFPAVTYTSNQPT